jgi:hypothetical protein
LAVGDPVVPPWFELTMLGWTGTVPILWMQLRRPFYIFSVPGLALRPDRLDQERRQLLALQRGWFSRVGVIVSAIALFVALYGLYQLAPIAATVTPLASQSRTTGWLMCAGAFFAANLFTQVPASVLPLLLARPTQIDQMTALEADSILQRFTVLGVRVAAILPDLKEVPVSVTKTDGPAELEHVSTDMTSPEPESIVAAVAESASADAVTAANGLESSAVLEAAPISDNVARVDDAPVNAAPAIVEPAPEVIDDGSDAAAALDAATATQPTPNSALQENLEAHDIIDRTNHQTSSVVAIAEDSPPPQALSEPESVTTSLSSGGLEEDSECFEPQQAGSSGLSDTSKSS